MQGALQERRLKNTCRQRGLIPPTGSGGETMTPRNRPAARGLRRTYHTAAGLVLGFAGLPQPLPAQVSRFPDTNLTIAEQVRAVVDLQRKAIVLATDVDSLPEEQRALVPLLGETLFIEKHRRLDVLQAVLVADSQQTAAFLDILEADPDLHDADKLAFRDLLNELATRAPAGLRPRIEEDRQAVAEIESLYRDEMREVLNRLGARGMQVRREAWEDYLGFLRDRYTIEGILGEYGYDRLAWPMRTRGPDAGLPLEVNGESLPQGKFVITIDDGPHARYTAQILDTLQQYGVPAVFFEVGENVARVVDTGLVELETADLTRRVIADGHLLGNHTLGHPMLTELDDSAVSRQIDVADRILESASGTEVRLFRPPYGARDERVLHALDQRGMWAYLWNVSSNDWADPIPESIAARVLERATRRGRGVILMHDIHSQTVAALPLILERLQQAGFEFVLWDGRNVVEPAVTVSRAPAPGPADSLYGESWAVLVGINEYVQWPQLAYAEADALGVRDALIERHGFRPDHITTLVNDEATRERILQVLGDELPRKVQPDDRVFVFFAGHGTTRQLPSGRDRGYIIPADADLEHLESQAISMSTLTDLNEVLAAKHVLYIMDACYSGLVLTRGGGFTGDPKRYLEEITHRPARQILTAGGADEQVADGGPNGHSVFTWMVLQGLDGQADLNRDRYVTASELAAFVSPRVSAVARQTPAFGNLLGSAGGDFVLALDRDAGAASDAVEMVDVSAELERVQEQNVALLEQITAMQQRLGELETRDGEEAEGRALISQMYNELGLELYRARKRDQALAAFRRAAEADPHNAEAFNNAGFMLYRLGRLEESVTWYRRTIDIDSTRAVTYLNLGDSLEELGYHADAVEAYQQYLALDPDGAAGGRVRKLVGRR
jgi:peptidoglycan/xylan/chitin deacetylase (PgdA/CDA1 family)/uncharacterized caspase-like protein